MNNLYPSYIVDNKIKKFLENKFTTKKNTSIGRNNKSFFRFLLKTATHWFLFKQYQERNLWVEKKVLKLFFHHSNCRTYFLERLFASCSKVHCCVHVYLCGMPILGETKCYLQTQIKEPLQTDTKSHILQHLSENLNCRYLCDDSCFTIIDHPSYFFRFIVKKVLHITWLKPVLNKQKNHVSITTST